jgi:hypothetical protein
MGEELGKGSSRGCITHHNKKNNKKKRNTICKLHTPRYIFVLALLACSSGGVQPAMPSACPAPCLCVTPCFSRPCPSPHSYTTIPLAFVNGNGMILRTSCPHTQIRRPSQSSRVPAGARSSRECVPQTRSPLSRGQHSRQTCTPPERSYPHRQPASCSIRHGPAPS